MSQTPHISALREHLLATLADLRDREHPMEPDRARAVAQVAAVLVDSAKVEVDYLRAVGGERAEFLHVEEGGPRLPAPNSLPEAHNPFPVSARHHLS